MAKVSQDLQQDLHFKDILQDIVQTSRLPWLRTQFQWFQIRNTTKKKPVSLINKYIYRPRT